MGRFFSILLLCACAAAQTAQTVEGIVANSVTEGVISGVVVELMQAGHIAYSAVTDKQGHFSVEQVKNGAYTARLSATDFFAGPEGPRAFQVSGDPVDLDLHLTPLGRITGRVTDGAAHPMPNARVELAGPGLLLIVATDAKGNFDLHQLLYPGSYMLAVVPPAGMKAPEPDPESGAARGWARTYYPGVADPQAASKIVLRPGAELRDLEVKLLALPTHAVRGVLVRPDGKPAPHLAIRLGEGTGTPVWHAESKADGTFEFPAVGDGEWILTADVFAGAAPATRTGVPDGDFNFFRNAGALRARQWIEVSGHDRENVKLAFSAPFDVPGKVVVEAPEGVAAPKLPPITLFSASRLAVPSFPEDPVSGAPEANGNFVLDYAYPGAYRVNPPDVPGYYLDAVRFGEAELTAPEVELFPGAGPLTLIYKNNGGTVSGSVEKCASGTVLLIPQDAGLRRPGFFRTGQCDASDRYAIAGVRPGDYYALAFPADPAGRFGQERVSDKATDRYYMDRRSDFSGFFDDGLLNLAARVTVRAGETTSADLQLTAPLGN